jgi:DNA-binding SARP family transcriptional activator
MSAGAQVRLAPDVARVQPDELPRQRLIDRLAERWRTPLLVMRADGGFGKTVALAQAIRDNATDPTGTDVYVSCRPYDRDARQLARSVYFALGLAVPESDDQRELAAALTGALAHLAPGRVCLVLDDVHHLGADGSSTRMVDLVLSALPANAHLVLAGRGIPSRFVGPRSDGIRPVLVEAQELLFDGAELVDLARRYAVDVVALEACGGWPAMTRLTLTAPAGTAVDYLIEEVVDGLAPQLRRALTVTVLGRRVDDALLAALDVDAAAAATAAEVPLVTSYPDGTISAHDLWDEALPRLVDTAELVRLGRSVSAWHCGHDRIDDAIAVGVRTGALDEAAAAVLAAISQSDAFLTGDRVQRWLSAFPPEAADRPELLLLRGITERMHAEPGLGLTHSEQALAGFAAADDHKGTVAAALEVGLTAWFTGNLQRVLEILVLAGELEARGLAGMRSLLQLGDYAVADLAGDAAAALAHLDAIDPETTPDAVLALVMRSQSTLCFLLGDAHRGNEIAQEVWRRWPMRQTEGIAGLARWQAGDSSGMREAWKGMRTFRRGNHRDDFLHDVYTAMVDAGFGIVADVSRLSAETYRTRESTFVAIATAASLVAAGEEEQAAAVLDEHLAAVGVDDPLCRGELRRFLPYGMILSPVARAVLEADDLGPHLVYRREIARAVLDARAGQAVDWRVLDDPDGVFCALALPWSVELAAAASTAGDPRGKWLAEHLADVTGSRARTLLRELANSASPAATGAADLLAAVPAEPAAASVVTACGRLSVAGADPTLLRRRRVRELLALLVLRHATSVAEIGAVLWPDLEPAQVRNNLRSTLTGVRKVLEPSRQPDDPPFHLRRQGDRLLLHRSDWLDIDVWHIQAALAEARADERAGRYAAAIAADRRAVEHWTDRVVADLADNDTVRAEIVGLERALGAAAVRVAQWSAANRELDTAVRFAERALRSDPYDDAAHGALMAALELSGRVAEATLAARRYAQVLETIGVPAGPHTASLLSRLVS